MIDERTGPDKEVSVFSWHRARYELAIERAQGKRVLDLGSGEGYGAAMLAGIARTVVAVDLSFDAVEQARRRYPLANLSFEQGDVTGYETGLDKFDLVTCFEVLEHVDDTDALFKTISNAIAPDGELLLSTPNRLVDKHFERLWGHHNHFHISVMSGSELETLARKYFENVEVLGQSVRGNVLHTALKSADVFNLRHRWFRSLKAQRRVERAMGKRPLNAENSLGAFRFSGRLLRQSPALFVSASTPRR